MRQWEKGNAPTFHFWRLSLCYFFVLARKFCCVSFSCFSIPFSFHCSFHSLFFIMLHSLALALVASFSFVSASPLSHQHVHSKRSAPPNPIQVSSAQYLCDVKSDLPVWRDLGFVGKIQDTVIHTYGDTLNNDSGPFFIVSDSSSIATDDPCFVLNTQRTSDGTRPTDMVSSIPEWNENESFSAFGGTNVIPTQGSQGMMFFLKNHRPQGGDQYIVGGGVADVFLSPDRNVSTFRLADYWWDALAGEPWYGDIGAYSDGTYVYGYGHGGQDHKYAYMTRAPLANLAYGFLASYEYWDGSTSEWTNTRMYNPSSEQGLQYNDVDGAIWSMQQGQMIWSPYYKKIM